MHFYFYLPLGVDFLFAQWPGPLPCFLSPSCVEMRPGFGWKHKQGEMKVPLLPLCSLWPSRSFCICASRLPYSHVSSSSSTILLLASPCQVHSVLHPPACTVPVPCACFSVSLKDRRSSFPSFEHSQNISQGPWVMVLGRGCSFSLSVVSYSLVCERRNRDATECCSLTCSGPQCCAICALHKGSGLME